MAGVSHDSGGLSTGTASMGLGPGGCSVLIAVAPAPPPPVVRVTAVAYAGAGAGVIAVTADGRVVRVSASGQRARVLANALPAGFRPEAVGAVRDAGSRLQWLVAGSAAKGAAAYRSADLRTWVEADAGLYGGAGGSRFGLRVVALHSACSALIEGNGSADLFSSQRVWVTHDCGDSWTLVPGTDQQARPERFAVDAASDTILMSGLALGTNGPPLDVGQVARRTTDYGAHWRVAVGHVPTQIHTSFGPLRYEFAPTAWIEADPGRPGMFLLRLSGCCQNGLGPHEPSFWRTADAGRSWHPLGRHDITHGAQEVRMSAITAGSKTTFLAWWQYGSDNVNEQHIARSDDHGRTWSWMRRGLSLLSNENEIDDVNLVAMPNDRALFASANVDDRTLQWWDRRHRRWRPTLLLPAGP